jgi:hypothetical protein
VHTVSFVSAPLCVAYHAAILTLRARRRYADHVGIHYVLCSKLRQFSYEELEFFLPQLCHLLVSVDNESMALEEFILDLAEESVNSALLVGNNSNSCLWGYLLTHKADVLAVPDLPPRPLEQPAIHPLQNHEANLQ